MKFRDWLFLMTAAFGSAVIVLWILMLILSKTGLLGLAVAMIIFGGGAYLLCRWADKIEVDL